MSRRSHRSLRLGALALLAAVAIWPRARAGMSAAELDSGSRGAATTHSVGGIPATHGVGGIPATHGVGGIPATHGVAARAETTAARLVSPPRTAKLTVAHTSAADEQLSN